MLRFALVCIALFGASFVWAQDDTARYKVEIAFEWSGDDGAGHPADPHWSRLIAVAHSSRYALFEDGQTASSGLALVATNGRVSVLEAELAEARRRGRAGVPIVQPGLESGVGTFVLDMQLDQKLSHVSFASMLAPSPDWFSGASGVALFVDDAWVEQLRVPLWVWDAGADHGPGFEGPNMDTQPRQSVRLLTHPAFLRPAGLQPIGHATFTRLP